MEETGPVALTGFAVGTSVEEFRDFRWVRTVWRVRAFLADAADSKNQTNEISINKKYDESITFSP